MGWLDKFLVAVMILIAKRFFVEIIIDKDDDGNVTRMAFYKD